MTITDTQAAATCCATSHAQWFSDVRRILEVVEVTPGLPLPFISSDRISFHLAHVVHAAELAEAVALAEEILSYALGVTFMDDTTQAAGPRHSIREAFLPGDLRIWIVSRAQDANLEGYVAARMAAIHAAVDEMPSVIRTDAA